MKELQTASYPIKHLHAIQTVSLSKIFEEKTVSSGMFAKKGVAKKHWNERVEKLSAMWAPQSCEHRALPSAVFDHFAWVKKLLGYKNYYYKKLLVGYTL